MGIPSKNVEGGSFLFAQGSVYYSIDSIIMTALGALKTRTQF
jgi:hypothetical protein